jgi:hypothetical protein
MHACADGDAEAIAVADTWRFRFPVRTMTAAEIEDLNPHVLFTGLPGEIAR